MYWKPLRTCIFQGLEGEGERASQSDSLAFGGVITEIGSVEEVVVGGEHYLCI